MTEITNIGQNLFMLANRGGILTSIELPVGIAWALSFFVVRVLPVPLILFAYAYTHLYTFGSCSFSTAEFVVSCITVPIPVALNLFWFYKIVSKAQRMISKKAKK